MFLSNYAFSYNEYNSYNPYEWRQYYPSSTYSTCGIKPVKPMRCYSGDYTCSCDSKGNCRWVLIGC